MMDYEYLFLIGAFNMLWITGVWNAALPGQILDPIVTWMAGDGHAIPPIKGWAPDWINKPLWTCPMCMASFHGVLFWLFFQPVTLLLLPIYVVCLSAAMKILVILVLNKDSD